VAGLILAAVLCMVVVPRHGQLGAAIATFSAIAFVNLVRLLWARRVMGGFPFDARLVAMVVAGIAIAAVARVLVAHWHLDTLWDALCGVGLFLFMYTVVCWWYLRSVNVPLAIRPRQS
jgi:O-antigen/teichoic acid export membrane protein